jgi:small subunit ribosomal protein S4
MDKRNFAPGMHGRRRAKLSPYGEQLREKQKVRRMYGILEKQFRLLFEKASQKKGKTGDVLLQMLETRLDNVVYRAGLAPARTTARMFVVHNHVTVNGRRVNVPSFQVRSGDVVAVKESDKSRKLAAEHLKMTESRIVPRWIDLDREKFIAKITDIPSREDIEAPINEQLIVELYSK